MTKVIKLTFIWCKKCDIRFWYFIKSRKWHVETQNQYRQL